MCSCGIASLVFSITRKEHNVMAELVHSRPQLARRQAEQIQSIVEVTQAAQREIGRVYTEGARMTVETLTDTTKCIQTAAENGAGEAKIAALIAQQKAYLAEMRYLADSGASEIAGIVRNLPALP